MSLESVLSRAGQWFVHSGIQQADGGIARYYRTDLERNHPASTEITGYAISALLYLNRPAEALAAARYLTGIWDGAMPFEWKPRPEKRFTYFFDCGIIVRGLLAAWRSQGRPEFLDVAMALGKSMIADFAADDGQYHPILSLPDKSPPPGLDPLRWSQAPGCYQLKSAMAWWELFETSGDAQFRAAYNGVLDSGLQCYRTFLPGHTDSLKVVDRLHAFLYFLEGMLPRAAEEECAAAMCEGIRRVAYNLEKTAPQFERSDVYAQLLRIRVYAAWAGIVPLDRAAAERERATLAEFQVSSRDSRIDGGFYFGRQAGRWLPYVNPVSTAFAVQALALWEQYQNGNPPPPWQLLI